MIIERFDNRYKTEVVQFFYGEIEPYEFIDHSFIELLEEHISTIANRYQYEILNYQTIAHMAGKIQQILEINTNKYYKKGEIEFWEIIIDELKVNITLRLVDSDRTYFINLDCSTW